MITPILELAISLVFIYFSFSLVVSWINEFITSRLATRGKYLREQLSAALDDQFNKNWAELLYGHPTVDLLAKYEYRPPAYIPGNLFATGLIDLIINEARIVQFKQDDSLNVILTESLPHTSPIENFKAGLNKLNKSEITILLQSFLDNADGDYEKLKINIITWYDDYMDRVTGWYKKKIRGWLFFISLFVAIAFNVNSIKLVTALWKNVNLRQTVVKAAEKYINDTETLNNQDVNKKVDALPDSLQPRTTAVIPDTSHAKAGIDHLAQRIDSVYNALTILNLPIGYNCTCPPASGQNKKPVQARTSSLEEKGYFSIIACAFKEWLADWNLSSIIGWLITAFALSYGAPFWFDILKKFVNVRSTGIKPEKSNY